MEVNEQTTETEVVNGDSSTSDAPADGAAAPQAEGTQATESATGAESLPQGYTPNLKFKVMDEEKEFNPLLAGIIKDQDTEKYFRELYEKAHGLDFVKPKYENLKGEYQKYKEKFDPINDDIAKLSTFLENKDFGSFFNTFGLTDEHILEYALNRIEYYKLAPEQRQAFDVQQKRNSEFANLKLENDKFKQQMESQSSQQNLQSLHSSLQAPEVSTIVTAFDQRLGQPGSFARAVVQYAQGVYASTGKDLEIPQAINQFIATMGIGSPAMASTQAAASAGSTQQQAARAKTLPAGGNSTSNPVAQKVRTLDDLKKLKEQVMQQGY